MAQNEEYGTRCEYSRAQTKSMQTYFDMFVVVLSYMHLACVP